MQAIECSWYLLPPHVVLHYVSFCPSRAMEGLPLLKNPRAGNIRHLRETPARCMAHGDLPAGCWEWTFNRVHEPCICVRRPVLGSALLCLYHTQSIYILYSWALVQRLCCILFTSGCDHDLLGAKRPV